MCVQREAGLSDLVSAGCECAFFIQGEERFVGKLPASITHFVVLSSGWLASYSESAGGGVVLIVLIRYHSFPKLGSRTPRRIHGGQRASTNCHLFLQGRCRSFSAVEGILAWRKNGRCACAEGGEGGGRGERARHTHNGVVTGGEAVSLCALQVR